MTASRNNRIAAENLKPGTLSWLPERLSYKPTPPPSGKRDPSYYSSRRESTGERQDRDAGRSARIEGWCSQATVEAGD